MIQYALDFIQYILQKRGNGGRLEFNQNDIAIFGYALVEEWFDECYNTSMNFDDAYRSYSHYLVQKRYLFTAKDFHRAMQLILTNILKEFSNAKTTDS